MGFDEKMIQVDNLSRSFGSVKAVDNISSQVKRGELFAFLGVNGAPLCGADITTVTKSQKDVRRSAGSPITTRKKTVDDDWQSQLLYNK